MYLRQEDHRRQLVPPPCPKQTYELQNQCPNTRRKNGKETAPAERRLCQVRMTTGTCKVTTCTTAVQLGTCSPAPSHSLGNFSALTSKTAHSLRDCSDKTCSCPPCSSHRPCKEQKPLEPAAKPGGFCSVCAPFL